MKRPIIYLTFLLSVIAVLSARDTTFRTGTDNIELRLNGKPVPGGWEVSPDLNPDILETTAREVFFASDIDTLAVTLDEWENFHIDMLTARGDTARVRLTRFPVCPFENPNPELLRLPASGKLTREQAAFDIDALVYTLNQVHPDIFSVCGQEPFFRAVNKAKASLPDSVSPVGLYLRVAPLVSMIGDGHTSLVFPFNTVFTRDTKRFPVSVNILSNGTMNCRMSVDSIIPRDARILSINGVSAAEMIDSMLPLVSGEKRHFRLAMVSYTFPALLQTMYPADSYTVEYLPRGNKKPVRHTFPSMTFDEILSRMPKENTVQNHEIYSFSVDSVKNVAIMDFRSFQDVGRMKHFADSMFSVLREKHIGNLIIDLRENGGGNSAVGDVLLRYLSPVPFVQMEKALVKVTPATARLMGADIPAGGFTFEESDPSEYIIPLTPQEGHYHGNVYLLTSNKTFSSAGSFAWAFKETGAGKTVGEETGGMNVSFGDILYFRLPVSKLSCSVSYKRFWQFHADENNIHGTLPDIPVPAADALDAAMKLVGKNRRK